MDIRRLVVAPHQVAHLHTSRSHRKDVLSEKNLCHQQDRHKSRLPELWFYLELLTFAINRRLTISATSAAGRVVTYAYLQSSLGCRVGPTKVGPYEGFAVSLSYRAI